jgi:hypothetical protein
MQIMAQNHAHFLLRKMGKKWAKSVFYGEKMGKFFELYIGHQTASRSP